MWSVNLIFSFISTGIAVENLPRKFKGFEYTEVCAPEIWLLYSAATTAGVVQYWRKIVGLFFSQLNFSKTIIRVSFFFVYLTSLIIMPLQLHFDVIWICASFLNMLVNILCRSMVFFLFHRVTLICQQTQMTMKDKQCSS